MDLTTTKRYRFLPGSLSQVDDILGAKALIYQGITGYLPIARQGVYGHFL
jgi:hypothetical protein